MNKKNGRYSEFHIRFGYTQSIDVTKKMCSVSELTLEIQANKILKQGYTKKNNPVCTECFVQRSNNGSCNC